MNNINEITLSIILPVYNVENYLRESVESILDTVNVNDIEIILVDDGSTDSSGDIADEYAKKREYINVYHKANGGLSDARNYGLYHAKGRYVFFMDSDDLLEKNAIDKILRYLKNDCPEILLFDATIVDSVGKIIKTNQTRYYTHRGLQTDKLYTGLDVIDVQLESNNDYVTTVWLGVYERKMLLKEALWFEKSLLHEDEMWTQKVLINAAKIRYVESSLYKYRIRNDSIMNDLKKDYSKNLASLIYIYNTLPSYIDWKVCDTKKKKEIKANLSKRYLHALYRFHIEKYPEARRLVNRWMIFKNSQGFFDKTRAIILLSSIHLYCKVMGLSEK